jgi:hypothetical protein
MEESAKLLVIVALAAFVTERGLALAAYVIDTVRYIRLRRGASLKVRAKAVRGLVLTSLAAGIAFVVVQQAHVRLLEVLKVEGVHPFADFLVSWLVVGAGADRVRSLLKGEASGGSAPASKAPSPLLQVRVNGGEIQELRRTA